MGSTEYAKFLESKRWKSAVKGFEPLWVPDFLFDFQKHIVEWDIRMGRAADFEDCGLGKTIQFLVWGENVLRKRNRPVIIFCPLAVAPQFVREGEKFGIKVRHSRDGKVEKCINVVNYDRMHHFNPRDFAAVGGDESGILKHQDAQTRRRFTEFASKVEFCLLGTATPAPNDYMELGNSAEALGVMKYHQVLSMFFTNDGETTQQWRLRGHAKRKFWQWVSSWARAIRKPSDLGYDDGKFNLPPMRMVQHVVDSPDPEFGFFGGMAITRGQQLEERRRTVRQRCEKVAELAESVGDRPFVAWCHLNVEGDLLEEMIPGAVQVAGCDSVESKEDRLAAFARGDIPRLVTKPKIGGFGLNLQVCSDISCFPSHSFEMFYQLLRRFWRFGQEREVTAHIVTSEAESTVLSNMLRKERQSREMYDGIVRGMGEFQVEKKHKSNGHVCSMELPSWL